MRLLITGASGFIGRHLVKQLLNTTNWEINTVVRHHLDFGNDKRIGSFIINDIATKSCWSKELKQCSVVIHAAARVHILKDNSANPLQEYRLVNVDSTMNLARQAAQSGIKRFIFISTIGVHGNETFNKSVTENTPFNPQTPYALSKLEAENALIRLAQSTAMEVVIIRPPLVYAEDALGNFGKLLQLASRKILLPLGSINNLRNLISRKNLIDFICCCVQHPEAKNQAFVVAEKEGVSTPRLISYLRLGMGLPDKIIPFPLSILKLTCKILGFGKAFNQLAGSYEIDSSKAQNLLNWNPKNNIKNNLVKVGEKFSTRKPRS